MYLILIINGLSRGEHETCLTLINRVSSEFANKYCNHINVWGCHASSLVKYAHLNSWDIDHAENIKKNKILK